MDTYERIWESVLGIIKQNVTPIAFDTWFLTLKISRIDPEINIVYLDIASEKGRDFIYNTIKKRYIPSLEEAFKEVLEEDFRVVIYETPQENFDVQAEVKEVEEVKAAPSKKKRNKQTLDQENILNPRFTFDNFVVGPSNRYAHAAALAVAESPADAFNPLFIHGGSGLGKTHLIQSIGITIIEKNPNLNVLYTDSETFTNELIRAIYEKKQNEFKAKYRKVDVLIIDDIQFIEGKESTQEEFFYTFNNLYMANKQIIISSDRPPNKLTNLDERLKSRFQWNLVADIQPPDFETRVAILRRKAENMNLEVDEGLDEVIFYIADKIKDNIRELEGAFNSAVSLALLVGEKPDRALAKRVLKNIASNSGELQVTPEKIKKIVCKNYGIKLSDLESSKKTNNIAFPRQVAMYLIRELTDSSLPQIGKYFGGKHHTTVKYAIEKIEQDIKTDSSLKDFVDKIKNEIKE